ncbi:hypothetical protein EWZ84_00785 [Helicobacter pylori]|nr:hypothetical protein [Helicobacter pylori]NHA88329.1 hypothetical protein [Helicobacter pylori]
MALIKRQSLKKALLYIRGVKLEIKRGRIVSNASYLFKRIKRNFNKMSFIIKSNLKRLFFTHRTFILLNFFKIFY